MPLVPEPTPPAVGSAPPYSATSLGSVNTPTSIHGLLPTATYYNQTDSYYALAGSGGGGAVDSVTAGPGLVVAPNTGAVTVSMPNVGPGAGAIANPASITLDAQGRVSAATSLGFTPVAPAALAAYAPLAGATFTGAVKGPTPVAANDLTTRQWVEEQIVAGGGVQSVTAGDASVTVAGTLANPTVAVATQAGVTPGAYTSANITVDSKGIITAVANGTPPPTLAAGTNIALDTTTTPGTTIIKQDITAPINMNSNQINNCPVVTAPNGQAITISGADVNITQTSTGLGAGVGDPLSLLNITAGAAATLSAVGAVSVSAGLAATINGTLNASVIGGTLTSIVCPAGEVHIGGPVNYVTVESDGKSMSGITNLSASGAIITTGSVTGGTVTATGAVNGQSVNATLNVEALTGNVRALGAAPGQGMVEAQQKIVAPYGEIDTVFTGQIQLGNNAGTNELTFLGNVPASHIVTVIPEGAAPGTVAGGVVDTLLNPATLAFDNVSKKLSVNALNAAGTTIKMGEADLTTALAAYVPLAGTAPGAPVTGAIQVEPTTGSIESKNITTALLSAIPGIDVISALAPLQVEGGNFLVANPAGSEIGLAASVNPPLDQVATITYNYTNDDLIHLNKVLEAPGAVLDGNDVVPLLTFKDAQTFYVSKQGSDSNSGAINAPFLTVQAAINAAVATNSEAVVDIAVGTYTENLTISSLAGILIRGCSQSDRLIEGTILNGVISIQCNTTDNLNNNQVMITGCTVLGHIHDTSTKQHTLIIDGCRIEGDNADGGRAIQVDITASTGRTFVNSCVITQEVGTTGTNPLISVNAGWLDMSDVRATVRAEGCAVTMTGDSLITRMVNCALESNSASANPNALVFLNSTTATPHNIALTSFAYSVATSKTTPAILLTRPSAGAIFAVIANCLFAIAGTLQSGNVIQYSVGTSPVLFVASNRSLNTAAGAYASQIQSGATVLPLTRVGETAVTSVNNLNGSLTLAAGSGLSLGTSGNTLTLTNTRTGVVETVTSGGAGISVTGTTANPVINNTGVTELVAGTGVSLSAQTGSVTISLTGGGGGGSAVDSVSAGTGITLTGTAQDVIVNNAGVLSVGVGTGLVNTGTASDPVIEISGTGTITTQQVDAAKVVVSGTGADYSTFGALPRVSGTVPTPTEPNQLVPLQYVDGIDTGVLSVTAADSSINVGGTPQAVTLSVASSGVTGGSYTNASITVGADGRVTAASSGDAPVLSVSGTTGEITSTGGVNPVLALANAGTAGVYAYPSAITTDMHGRVVAATAGTQPVTTVNAGAGIDVVSSAGSATVSNTGVLTVAANGSSVVVEGDSQNPRVRLPVQATLSPGTYDWASISVNENGVITSATSSGTPYTNLTAGSGIDITSTGLGAASVANTGVLSLNSLNGAVSVSAGSGIAVDSTTTPGVIAISATGGSGTVTSVSGTAGQIAVANGTTTPVLSLVDAGTAGTYAFPSSVQTDSKGRVVAITAGTNPSGTYLPLAGGTMSGPINMGGQVITNAGTITTAGVVASALSLPNAGAGGTAAITALQTDTNAAPTNNLFITQTSGALSLFKPIANPVILYSAGASTNLFTYLVPQFYGERHIYTGSAVSPVLNYNTSNNYTVAGNTISLNPFYVELTNGSSSALTVKVRYPNGGTPPAQYPPASTLPTTVAPAGTWADQTILPVGLLGTTTPTIASGATKRLFFNGTNWYLI